MKQSIYVFMYHSTCETPKNTNSLHLYLILVLGKIQDASRANTLNVLYTPILSRRSKAFHLRYRIFLKYCNVSKTQRGASSPHPVTRHVSTNNSGMIGHPWMLFSLFWCYFASLKFTVKILWMVWRQKKYEILKIWVPTHGVANVYRKPGRPAGTGAFNS